jgi:hypothetical protein
MSVPCINVSYVAGHEIASELPFVSAYHVYSVSIDNTFMCIYEVRCIVNQTIYI